MVPVSYTPFQGRLFHPTEGNDRMQDPSSLFIAGWTSVLLGPPIGAPQSEFLL